MSHTYSQTLVHIVFSTKERRNLIREPERFWAYLQGICKHISVESMAIGGTANHVHLLVAIPTDLCIAKLVNQLKVNSSRWAKGKTPAFAWQRGFGSFSVSASSAYVVKEYIRTQEEHHRKRNFEDEFIALLQKHGVEFDPKYVFG